MGSFTCRLEYALAPRTVANFIALAIGGRTWLELPSGKVKTRPFYDGTTFHRVIAGFMNQGGSRNGLGTDGPGYQFVDDLCRMRRRFVSGGNSGRFKTVRSSSSRFRWASHRCYSVLLIGRRPIMVYAINYATGGGDKPLTNGAVDRRDPTYRRGSGIRHPHADRQW
jgi:hypothetical protein